MKRDMNLVRSLLLEIEGWDETDENPSLETQDEGVSESVIYDHLELMAEAGLIKTVVAGGRHQPQRLTWKGHEFLDAVRNEVVWAKTKEKVGSTVGSTTVEILKAVAAEFTKSMLFPPA